MRWMVVALALAGCAQNYVDPPASPEVLAATRRANEEWVENYRVRAAAAAAAEASLTPRQRAQRDADQARLERERQFNEAKTARERELLQRALSGSPDYMAAVRRAAVANIEGATAAPGVRVTAPNARAREAAITAEEARISDAVEALRRRELANRETNERQARYQQSVANCQGQAAQVEASMFNPRSLLNLDGAIAGAQFRNSCINSIPR